MATKKDTTPAEVPESDERTLDDAVRLRAYEISQSADASTPEENWHRAERELGPVTADQ